MISKSNEFQADKNNLANKSQGQHGFYVTKQMQVNIAWRINLKTMKIIDLSNGCKSFLGLAAQDIIGSDLTSLLTPNSYQSLQEMIPEWLQKLQNNKVNSLYIVGLVEHRVRNSEKIVWSKVNARLFLAKNGEIIADGVSSEADNQEELLPRCAELAKREKLVQSMWDAQPCYLSCVDFDGNYLLVNKRFADHWNCDKNSLVGKKIHSKLPERLVKKHTALFAKAKHGETVQFIEFAETHRLNPEKGKAWYYGQYYPVYDDSGKVEKIIVAVVDFTEQYLMKELLGEAEKAGHTGSWRLNLINKKMTCSDGAIDLYGLTQDDVSAQSYKALLDCHSDIDKERIKQTIGHVIRTGKTALLEVEIILPTGKNRWLSLSCHLIRDKAGTPFEVFARIEDINKKKAIENINQIIESRLRGFLRTLPGAGIIADNLGKIHEIFDDNTVLSEALTRQLNGGNLFDVFMSQDAKIIRDKINYAVEKEQLQFHECFIKSGSSQKFFNIRISPLSYGMEDYITIALYLTDKTEVKKIEKTINDSYIQKSKQILLNELVEGKLKLTKTVLDQAWDLGLNLAKDFSLFLLNFQGENSSAFYTRLIKQISAQDEELIVWKAKEGTVVLKQVNENEKDIKKAELKYALRLQNLIDKEIGEEKYAIGIAEFFPESFAILDKIYEQAVTAVKLGAKARPNIRIFHYLDIGVFQFFPAVNKSDYMESFIKRTIGKLEQYDQEHETNLVETLVQLLKAASLKEVADNMFVHRQTVLFRRKRIEQILNITLDDFETKLALSMALKFRQAFRTEN